MSGTAEPRGVTMNTVPGLVEYYASQANVMLSQYKNINLLLGHTHDWQHPGELCEILLRDFLRRFLPTVYSVDKGFIYGRTTVDDGIHLSTTPNVSPPYSAWVTSPLCNRKPCEH